MTKKDNPAPTGATTVPEPAQPAIARYLVLTPIRIGAERIEPGTPDAPVFVELEPTVAEALTTIKAVQPAPETPPEAPAS